MNSASFRHGEMTTYLRALVSVMNTFLPQDPLGRKAVLSFRGRMSIVNVDHDFIPLILVVI